MRRRRSFAAAVVVAMIPCIPGVSVGCADDDCDARKYCEGKTDKIITGDKIIPVCGAATENDGTT